MRGLVLSLFQQVASQHAPHSTAAGGSDALIMNLTEWFGIPLMPGFIPILVDDKNPKEYELLYQLMKWDYDLKDIKSP